MKRARARDVTRATSHGRMKAVAPANEEGRAGRGGSRAAGRNAHALGEGGARLDAAFNRRPWALRAKAVLPGPTEVSSEPRRRSPGPPGRPARRVPGGLEPARPLKSRSVPLSVLDPVHGVSLPACSCPQGYRARPSPFTAHVLTGSQVADYAVTSHQVLLRS